MTILLDNGHGIETKGKRSPRWADGSQLFEWEFNRDLVRRIAERCTGLGVSHCVIVPEEHDIALSERCHRASVMHNMLGETLLISVHANAGGGTGFEVFTTKGETAADKYASKWAKQIKKDFPLLKMRCDFADGDEDKEENFYILRHTTAPAILCENLFMDNEEDCKLLLSEDFREALAESYIKFIQSIL